MLLLLLLGRHGRRCCLRRVWPGTAVDRASFTEVALPLLLLLLLLFLFLLFFFFFFFFFCCCCSSSSFFPTSSLHPPPGGRPTHRLGRFPFRARLGRVRPMASLGLRSRAVSIVASFFFCGGCTVRCQSKKKATEELKIKTNVLFCHFGAVDRWPIRGQDANAERPIRRSEMEADRVTFLFPFPPSSSFFPLALFVSSFRFGSFSNFDAASFFFSISVSFFSNFVLLATSIVFVFLFFSTIQQFKYSKNAIRPLRLVGRFLIFQLQ